MRQCSPAPRTMSPLCVRVKASQAGASSVATSGGQIQKIGSQLGVNVNLYVRHNCSAGTTLPCVSITSESSIIISHRHVASRRFLGNSRRTTQGKHKSNLMPQVRWLEPQGSGDIECLPRLTIRSITPPSSNIYQAHSNAT